MLCKLSLLAMVSIAATAQSQTVDPSFYQEMKWRCIGPFRAGRTVGVSGVVQQPGVFYMGVNNGGVWKTNDYGRTWKPIFDEQPTGSIGDLAVAPSDPNVVYVGTGEGLQRPDLAIGNGMYRSDDAGKTWRHLGLEDIQQIAGIAIDAKDPNRVFVAGLGHPYGANEMRGVFRSLDGGKNWKKVLYLNDQTGSFQVTIDPKDPNTIYADMWQGQQGPWENAYLNGPASGLYKSTDGGDTWKQLTGGLPGAAENLGRIGFGISPSNPKIIYATVDARNGGIYRSDDAGETWRLVANQPRLWGRGDDFAEIKVHPFNSEEVFVGNTCSYKSLDGGKTWFGWKGSPGGDDYHRFWIHPENPDIILAGVDQGATLTVNGGQTWSSWYNQPTAQMYHINADNAYPYRLYSGQQESGSVGIASRGNDGAVSFREWHPVGVEEYGYCVPDPLDPNIVYGGKLVKFDWRNAQVQDISPRGDYRFLRTAPLIFSPADPKTLFYAGNVVFKTRNGGSSWDVISPDLSREKHELTPSVGKYATPEMEKMPRRGVVYSLGPSKFDVNLLWAGTDDGLVWVTRDGGKHWTNVTPPGLEAWSKISQIDAGHFDKDTAYIAVNRFRCDDLKPHIYKTHDRGKSWTHIGKGLPDAPINVVREDPEQPGLLFAGSETHVSFSIDDGSSWNTVRQNMPATSIRDLIVKDDDLCLGTHGRSFWIMDDITPLRQIASAVFSNMDVYRMSFNAPVLFRPQQATRVRWDMNTDTPIPPEEPVGKNPPDGAIINYYLAPDSKGPVVLEILDEHKNVVRRYASTDEPKSVDVDRQPIPAYWIRPPQVLSDKPGMHRFYWDLHWGPAPDPRSIPMQAIIHDTAPEPKATWAMPGKYFARLTVDGKSQEQSFTLRMDPRVEASREDLQMQFDLAKTSWDSAARVRVVFREMESVRAQITEAKGKANGDQSDRLTKLDAQIEALMRAPTGLGFRGNLADQFGGVYNSVQRADARPTLTVQRIYDNLIKRFNEMENKWSDLKAHDLDGFTVPDVQSPMPPFEEDVHEEEP